MNNLNKRILTAVIVLPVSLFFIIKGGNYIVSFLYAVLILANFEAFSVFKRKITIIFLDVVLVISLLSLLHLRNDTASSFVLLLWVILLTVSSDVGGYTFGKIFKWKKFKFISCHNWIQHTPNPQKVFINLSSKMLPGSRFYLSCYLSGTFRFFITQIAREIIKDQDFNLIVKKTKKYFSDGFKIFKNPDNISARHITDDFLSPYVIPTTYKNILSLAKQCGLEPIVRGPKIKNLSFQDSIPLRLGFIKKEKKILKKKIKNYFVTPVDEFKENKNKYAQKASKLALNLIKKKSKLDKNQRVDICLKLFQIRAEYCNQKIKDKYIDLIVYLQKINKKI